jgi:hypothetical protein
MPKERPCQHAITRLPARKRSNPNKAYSLSAWFENDLIATVNDNPVKTANSPTENGAEIVTNRAKDDIGGIAKRAARMAGHLCPCQEGGIGQKL